MLPMADRAHAVLALVTANRLRNVISKIGKASAAVLPCGVRCGKR